MTSVDIEKIWLEKQDNSLKVLIREADDGAMNGSVLIKNYYQQPECAIESITAGGYQLSGEKIAQMVNLMSAFSSMPGGMPSLQDHHLQTQINTLWVAVS